jgi:molecular chaperone GrpE
MTWKINRRSAESMDSVPEETSDPGTAGAEEPAPVEDPAAQINAEIESLKSELAQCQDRFLRKAAEFDNYRKRMERERNEAAQMAKSSVILEMLPVADACDRALESLKTSQVADGLDQYREGVRLLYKQIHDVMNRLGVAPIDAQGKAFDPHLHEAITREVSHEYEDNVVIDELRRGYMFKDRLLRPSQVRVSAGPPPKEPSET